MSSYNENLHSGVVSSLSAQELDLQNVEAKLEASMLSLYYAQGARITTAEELEITTAKYAYEKKVHEQAIIDSDLSTNVLSSANNAKDYTAKSVTNTSVAAANVQIAANAILKLASDVGSIFSIVNAADYDTDIYAQSNKAYVLMNDTAYDAEKASQHSMEASSDIAEVTSESLAGKATTTDTSIKDLLAVVTKQYDDTTTLLSTQSAELATANTKEKAAEGTLEDYSVSYNATGEAYDLNNTELNLDLKVITPGNVGDRDHYQVSFSAYKSAFNIQAPDGKARPAGYPVDSYYIMLVEKSKSSTFNVNDAEGIVTEGYTQRYIAKSGVDNPDGVNATIKVYPPVEPKDGSKADDVVPPNHKYLFDTDGNQLELGKDYVIFVLIVFTNDYKKSINNFDDYLTAPSKMFSIHKQLNAVDSDGIEPPTADNVINFGVFENPEYITIDSNGVPKNIDYRCAFLPNNEDLVRGLLTAEELKYIDHEVRNREQLVKFYDSKITRIQNQINALKNTSATATDGNNSDAKNTNAADSKSKSKKASKSSDNDVLTVAERRKILNYELVVLRHQKEIALENEHHIQPGFFFNLTIAEQIPAGSYVNASVGTVSMIDYLLRELKHDIDKLDKEKKETLENDLNSHVTNNSGKGSDIEAFIQQAISIIEEAIKGVITKKLANALANFDQLIKELMLLGQGYKFYSKQVTLAPETTDNFGNRLINQNDYILSVISISNNPDESVNTQFLNALSDFQHTTPFTYNDPYAVGDNSYPKVTTINQS
jgi:hypothetical protein